MRKHLLVLAILFVTLACMAGCAAPAQSSIDSSGSQPSSTAESTQPQDVATSTFSSDSAANAQASSAAADGQSSSAVGEQSQDITEGNALSESAASSNQSGDGSGNAEGGEPSQVPDQASGNDSGSTSGAAFPSWNADAKSLAALVSYVEAATEEGGTRYVPPEDRIAVFDMDGTFLCERAPVYTDYMLLLHRIQDDPNYAPTGEMNDLGVDMRDSADEGVPLADADRDYKKNDALAESFEGMTFDELHDYVTDFMATEDVEGFSGMKYGESFYLPMLEVIGFLKDNDFDVYVVTASEREIVRPIVEPLGIDPSHVIGSDWSYEATNQGDEEGANYTYEQADDLVLGGEYLGETGKTNKVIAIQREIGKKPVLAFGNSSGDFAMLNYTLDNGKFPSAAFLVIADDTEREYGNEEKAADMLGKATEAGWTPISMRDDWSTIYGDGVEKTQLVANEKQESANTAQAA